MAPHSGPRTKNVKPRFPHVYVDNSNSELNDPFSLHLIGTIIVGFKQYQSSMFKLLKIWFGNEQMRHELYIETLYGT